MSRYTSKRDAQVRAQNTLRHVAGPRRPQFVPRWIKRRVTDLILEGRAKEDFDYFSFGCKLVLAPDNTIVVAWRVDMPVGLPRTLRIRNTVYRLEHRKIQHGEGFGADDFRDGLCNGYKYRWWEPPRKHGGGDRLLDYLRSWD